MADTPTICIVGAGAVGGYAAAMMARHGTDIVVVDAWCEHVAAMRKSGLTIESPDGTFTQPLEALHINEVQKLRGRYVPIIFICVKMYDTAWATELARPYLAADGCIVTMQNGLMEPVIARIAGWERTVGCIASTLSTHLVAPGRVVRTRTSGGAVHDVFRVGEVHGRVTPRVQRIAEMLAAVDSVRVTTNLWGERWAKLIENSMTSGISAVTGLGMREIFEDEGLVRLMVRIAAEGIETGNALGYAVQSVRGLAPDVWPRAATGDPSALTEVRDRLRHEMERITGNNISGSAQDISRGRVTEIDFLNGYLEQKSRELGLQAETNRAVAALVRQIERQELTQSRDLLMQ